MGIQIALVKADDWQGLYVNEERVCQDHKIGIETVMQYVLHNHVDQFQVFHANEYWLARRGKLPKNLRKVILGSWQTIAEYWESE